MCIMSSMTLQRSFGNHYFITKFIHEISDNTHASGCGLNCDYDYTTYPNCKNNSYQSSCLSIELVVSRHLITRDVHNCRWRVSLIRHLNEQPYTVYLWCRSVIQVCDEVLWWMNLAWGNYVVSAKHTLATTVFVISSLQIRLNRAYFYINIIMASPLRQCRLLLGVIC